MLFRSKAQAIPATLDNGYYREAAAQALEDLGFDPYMATGRQKHHAPEAEAIDAPATAKERMAAQVRTPEGKALYARRRDCSKDTGLIQLGHDEVMRGFVDGLRLGLHATYPEQDAP